MSASSASPTGIATTAWICLRACQVFLSFAAFIAGAVEDRRIFFVYPLLLPIFLLSLWNLIDASVFYKNRYARGPGAISILRTLYEWFMNCLLAAAVPLIFVSQTEDIFSIYEENRSETFTWIMFSFIVTNMCLYFATAVMMSVEDARLRKVGRTLIPSATEAMPTSGEPMYRGSNAGTLANMTHIDAETALTLVNNMLKNGFTIQQIAIMGNKDFHSSGDVSPSKPPPMSLVKRSSYEPGPPHYAK